jgi:hypothetical protein
VLAVKIRRAAWTSIAIAGAWLAAHAPAAAQMAPKLAPHKVSPVRPPAPVAVAAAPPVVVHDQARATLLTALIAAADGGADVDEQIIRFEPLSADRSSDVHLSLGTRIAAPMAQVVAQLGDPATYRRAVPAFVRADVRAVAPAAVGLGPPRLIDWELEVPLWNFSGQLWLHPRPEGATLDLAQGDLRPGHLELTVAPDGAARSILILSGSVNLRNANWITRRLAALHAEAEPAMVVTALFVLLRGLRLDLERPADDPQRPPPRRWPAAAPQAPAAATIDATGFGKRLASHPALGHAAAAASTFARVLSGPAGRLDRIEVAVPLRSPRSIAAARVLEPALWRALPGWKRITPTAARPPAGPQWQVDGGLLVVDFDAIWSIVGVRPFRAEARAGDWTGAMMGVDIVDGPPARLLLTSNPRIDASGYVPRRLIAAEPLLEHGLALGLAFVDAQALVRALATP